MAQVLLAIDTQLTHVINTIIPHNYVFDLFFSFFSMIGSAAFIWIVIVLLLIVFEEKRHRRFVISFTIGIIVTAVVVNVLIKNLVQRTRPTVLTAQCPKDFSFPSGHAATAFTAATIIAFYDKKRGWFYYMVASLISLSRIYLSCHYFLDVTSGALIGYLIAVLITLQRKKFFSPRKLEK